jgi:ATP-binding cassette, subfamily B, bacterial
MSSPTAESTWRHAAAMLAPDWPFVLLAVLLLVTATIGGLSGPWIVRYAIDHGLSRGVPQIDIVRHAALLFLAISALAMIAGRLQIVVTGIAGERLLRRLRERAVAHIMAMSARYHDRNPAGRLVSRVTSDMDALQDLLQLGLAQFVQSTLTLLLLAVLLMALSWQLALLALLPAPLLIAATIRFRQRSRGAFRVVRERVGETLSTLIESLAGVKVIQAFVQERQRTDHFLARNEQQLAANIASVVVQARYLPAVELTMAVSLALAVGCGGELAARGLVTVGTVAAFALYLTLAFEPIQALSFLFNQVEAARAAFDKIFGLLGEPIDRPGGDVELPRRGELVLAAVTFRYATDGPPVLSGIDLDLAHGERLALIGPTGAGKSTLAKLIAGALDADSGSIRYGGVDLAHASPEALRRRIVMLTQEGHLFHGTLADNLRAARPGASDGELKDALRRIGVWDRFTDRPLGLDAPIGERGTLLSSGERQLVGLARIALLGGDVLVLDEPTATLDPATERLVNRALERLMEDRTVILVAHRLATMEMVDRIALVDGGCIIEMGSHEELLAACGSYAALYAAWQAASAA